MEKNNLIQQKNSLLLVENLYKKEIINKNARNKLIIAINYYYNDLTYEQLAVQCHVSVMTVRRAMDDEIIKEIMGKSFFNELKQKRANKKRTAYQKRGLIDMDKLTTEELLLFNIVKKTGATITTEKQLNILKTVLYYIENNCSYKEISDKLGFSKATISLYLNDENLESLIKEEYYIEIKNRLQSKTPAPSKSISIKKAKLMDIINYIKNISYDIDTLDELSVRKMSRELGIDYSTLMIYLNDDYFKELINRDYNKTL